MSAVKTLSPTAATTTTAGTTVAPPSSASTSTSTSTPVAAPSALEATTPTDRERLKSTWAESATKRARGEANARERVFLVDAEWWSRLSTSVGAHQLPPLDNSRLLVDPVKRPGVLRPNLVERVDFEVMDELAWGMVKTLYAGPKTFEIQRFTTGPLLGGGSSTVELYPLRVGVCWLEKDPLSGQLRPVRGSVRERADVTRSALLEDVVSLMRSTLLLGVDGDGTTTTTTGAAHRLLRSRAPADVEEWPTLLSGSAAWQPLDGEFAARRTTLAELGWSNDVDSDVWSLVVGFERPALFATSSSTTPSSLVLYGNPTASYFSSSPALPEIDAGDNAATTPSATLLSTGTGGRCGLTNLGNTCYMNSALQCLSNTAPLRAKFLGNVAAREVNRTNKMGYKGESVDAFSSLLRLLWSGKHSTVAPRGFKAALDRWTSSFRGWHQHDSQELLSFVLDALHEDLARVPAVADAAAATTKTTTTTRPGSLIDDLFAGMLRSYVKCPEPDCSFESVTEEPFRLLSLEMPASSSSSSFSSVSSSSPHAGALAGTSLVPNAADLLRATVWVVNLSSPVEARALAPTPMSASSLWNSSTPYVFARCLRMGDAATPPSPKMERNFEELDAKDVLSALQRMVRSAPSKAVNGTWELFAFEVPPAPPSTPALVTTTLHVVHRVQQAKLVGCLLYTSDAADD